MIYIEHYLYLFKQHNRPWSDMEKGIFIMIMAFTVAMCFIAVLRKKINILKAIAIICLVICFCFLYATTLFTRQPLESRQFRCLLAQDWKLFAAGVQSERDQVTLNVILFLPFGILWDIIRENKSSLKECAVIGGIISLSVETMQYISVRGVFDIEDLLTNIIGMIIGTVIIKVIYII